MGLVLNAMGLIFLNSRLATLIKIQLINIDLEQMWQHLNDVYFSRFKTEVDAV